MAIIVKHDNRIIWVDYLRTIGLFLVILPHVFGIPNYFFEMLFACNVPIMVFVSGYVSYRSANCSIMHYYSKRMKNLIMPAYIFFVLFFGIVTLLTYRTGFPFGLNAVIKTFLFMDGIGYTWIVAVFIMIALITPIMGLVVHRVPISIMVIPLIYVVTGLGILMLNIDNILAKAFLYIAGYAVIGFCGYVLNLSKKFGVFYFVLMSCAYLISTAITARMGIDPFVMSANKYPPTLLYISYGTSLALLFMFLCKKIEKHLCQCPLTSVCVYVSKNSYSLYLWHILGIYLTTELTNHYLRVLLVFAVSIIGTIIYRYLLKWIFRAINWAKE